MSIYAVLSLIASIECFIIGTYVFSKSPKETLNRLFSLMCFSEGVRAFVEFGYRQSESLAAASFWQMIDVIWAFTPLFVFHFIYYYVFGQYHKKHIIQKIMISALYAIAFSLTLIEIFTDVITGPPQQFSWGWSYSPGTFEPALMLATGYAYLLCFAGAIILVIHTIRNRGAMQKAGSIMLSCFFSFIIISGILSEILLPVLNISFPETSNIATAIAFIPLGYLVWKNRLFAISPDKAVNNIITSMQDTLILINPEGLIKYSNPAASRLLGYGQEELLDLPVLLVIPVTEKPLTDLLLPVPGKASPEINYMESNFRAKSGELIPVSVSLSQLIMKGNGSNIGSVCIARDISERKRKDAELAEYRLRLEELVRLRTENLRKNYQRFITLFRESPSALVEVDLTALNQRLQDFRASRGGDIIRFCMERPLEALRLLRLVKIVQINKALLVLFDVSGKEEINSSRHKLFRKKSYVVLMKLVEALCHGENDLESDGIIYRPGGGERYISLKLSFIADSSPDAPRALVSIVDITPQKRAEEEKAELEEQLRHVQKMEALGTLAGGIAHDFNNLLSGILGYADLIKSDLAPESRHFHDAEVIERTANKAAVLVRQLLNFARKGKQHNVTFDLQLIIDEVITILKHTIDKRIKIVRRFLPNPIFILGDPGQMEQVVINLAVNACDAMPDGGELVFSSEVVPAPARKIFAYPHLNSEFYVKLEVIDTGVGVPEEIRDRIFEPFFTTKPAGRGTGMGLAVVYGIIANHEGLIEVEDNKPRGTLFRTYLPLVERRAAPAAPPPSEPVTRGQGRILVVDDEEVVCRVIERMLGHEGYSIELARDGEEAIERYSREKEAIDLVLIDMIMPKMNGRDCFRAMRKMNPGLKAVLITGHLPEGSAFEAITEGMKDVIFKPFSRGKLTEVVRTALKD